MASQFSTDTSIIITNPPLIIIDDIAIYRNNSPWFAFFRGTLLICVCAYVWGVRKGLASDQTHEKDFPRVLLPIISLRCNYMQARKVIYFCMVCYEMLRFNLRSRQTYLDE